MKHFFKPSIFWNSVYTITITQSSIYFSADEILPVGSIRVNSLNELCLSPALKDLLDFTLTRQHSGARPVLNTKSKVLELDSCRTIGKVWCTNIQHSSSFKTWLEIFGEILSGLFSVHWRVMVSVVGDPWRRMGVASRLVHALLPDGTSAPWLARMAGILC